MRSDNHTWSALNPLAGHGHRVVEEDIELLDVHTDIIALRRLCLGTPTPQPTTLELECLAMTRSGTARPATLVRRIGSDRRLEKRLLREAHPQQARSIGHLVALVGVADVGSLVLQSSIGRAVFRRSGHERPSSMADLSIAGLWRHAQHVAAGAVVIADNTCFERDTLVAASLLREAGVACALHAALDEPTLLDGLGVDMVLRAVATINGTLTLRCADHWGVDADARAVLEDITATSMVFGAAAHPPADVHPAVPAVVLADELALRARADDGEGLGSSRQPCDDDLAWAIDSLGLSDAALRDVERAIRERTVSLSR